MIKCISNVVQRFIYYLVNRLKECEEGFKATKLGEHFEHVRYFMVHSILFVNSTLREFLFFSLKLFVFLLIQNKIQYVHDLCWQ